MADAERLLSNPYLRGPFDNDQHEGKKGAALLAIKKRLCW
jgi:hypothetical protein